LGTLIMASTTKKRLMPVNCAVCKRSSRHRVHGTTLSCVLTSLPYNILLELSSRTFMYIYYLEAYLSRNRWTSFLASELAVVNSKIEAEM
jgi:hypothetical protein